LHSQAVIVLLVLVTKDSEAAIDMLKEKECCAYGVRLVCVRACTCVHVTSPRTRHLNCEQWSSLPVTIDV